MTPFLSVYTSPLSPRFVFYQALLITGAIFKATVPDESDEERRELERYASCLSAPPRCLLTVTLYSYHFIQDGGGGCRWKVEAFADAGAGTRGCEGQGARSPCPRTRTRRRRTRFWHRYASQRPACWDPSCRGEGALINKLITYLWIQRPSVEAPVPAPVPLTPSADPLFPSLNTTAFVYLVSWVFCLSIARCSSCFSPFHLSVCL